MTLGKPAQGVGGVRVMGGQGRWLSPHVRKVLSENGF